MSRRKGRYERRKTKREENRLRRAAAVGGLHDVFGYDDMYKAGKKCCNGVRWKNSTQRFEMHLFSGTARRRRLLLERKWIPGAYVHFTISERGKTRPIDAPRIQDRQVHKVYTKKVLLPLYRPEMIYNNGASLEGKGFEFSKRMLKEDLRWHFRRYGRDGNVILIDFKQFFPSVSHEEIFKRHEKLLLNPDIRKIGDDVVNTVSGGVGLPLGVEPSQAEMIAFPSALDNFIKCQLSIKCAGHYMDDYYVIVPPDRDAKEIMALIVAKAESLKLTVSKSKSRIVPLTKPFRYCKAKFILTETGRVVMNGNRDGVKRARRKIKAFRTKIQNGEMSYDDLWTSVNGMLAYFESYDDHNRVLRLRRLFYSVFGFSPERIENFRERGKRMKYVVHRRFKDKAICGEVNLPAMTMCEETNGYIFYGDKLLCIATSENAHQFFARDDDDTGMLRGKLTQAIQKTLAKRDANYQNRWDKVWEDPTCQPYKRIEYADFWLWNHDFFNADIDTLRHIAKLVGAKEVA